jgi:hypothetical protein
VQCEKCAPPEHWTKTDVPVLRGTNGRGQRLDATEGPQIEGWVVPCKDIGGRFPAAALRFDPSALERFGPEAGDHPCVQALQ